MHELKVCGGEGFCCNTVLSFHRGLKKTPKSKPEETLQWNGTTNKKKGQKWGREKISKRAYGNASNSESSQKLTIEDGHLVDKHVKYESLPPICRLPKVGKIQSYDSVSLTIVLVPLPEYPIFMTEKEADQVEPNISPYKEDGSLENELIEVVVHFSKKPHMRLGVKDGKLGECFKAKSRVPGILAAPS